MATTPAIDDRLLAEAKPLAPKQRTTLTRLIEEGQHLRLRLPVFDGSSGLVAGVDPRSNKALLAALGNA